MVLDLPVNAVSISLSMFGLSLVVYSSYKHFQLNVSNRTPCFKAEFAKLKPAYTCIVGFFFYFVFSN